jgi:hypothetical protein
MIVAVCCDRAIPVAFRLPFYDGESSRNDPKAAK